MSFSIRIRDGTYRRGRADDGDKDDEYEESHHEYDVHEEEAQCRVQITFVDGLMVLLILSMLLLLMITTMMMMMMMVVNPFMSRTSVRFHHHLLLLLHDVNISLSLLHQQLHHGNPTYSPQLLTISFQHASI